MTLVLCFVFGCFMGFDLALTYVWLTARRANRSVTHRVAPYIRFDTPAARQALRQARKPW